MNLSLFANTFLESLKYILYFLLIFFISRVIFLFTYIDIQVFSNNTTDILHAFGVGTIFDISVICYTFLPIALLWLVSLFISKSKEQSFLKIYLKTCQYYLNFALFVLIAFQIIDFFFYQFFQSRINALFFGIFKDDTIAVLNSVWTDYPIFKILSIFFIGFSGFYFIHLHIIQHINKEKQYPQILKLCLLSAFPLLILGMRGSFGEFTLRRDHTNVSINPSINALCYNSLYALKFANSELKESEINPDISNEIKASGFPTLEAIKSHYEKNMVGNFDKNFYSVTPKNDFLEKNPPNVVFILMESMSNHYFELHNQEMNLLGELSTVLPDLYYFKNGLSSRNGTIYTLENLLVNSPKGIISQSPYFNVPFEASIAKPFKEQNYETLFITGANLSWRNVDNFIKNQFFDNILGSNHIQEKIKNTESFAWGVHDGYLFDFIHHTLKQNSKKPRFVFALTVSNHTPYEIPKHYKTSPIKISDSVKQMLRIEEKMAYENFYSHQYAASQLGKFIKEVQNSPLGENTLIVATGDHNIRQVFEYNDQNYFLKYSVPILFYIPEKYKPSFFDSDIMVSHKDIFPSIFNLTLSNQKYIYSGDNMFSPSKNYRFALNDYNIIADNKGVLSLENNTPIYRTWINNSKRKLQSAKTNDEHAQFMLKKLKTFASLQNINTYQSIHNHQKKQSK